MLVLANHVSTCFMQYDSIMGHCSTGLNRGKHPIKLNHEWIDTRRGSGTVFVGDGRPTLRNIEVTAGQLQQAIPPYGNQFSTYML